MSLKGFSEFSPSNAAHAKTTNNPLFVTLHASSMAFSKAVNAALSNAAHVKILFNEEENQFAIMPTDEDAWTFLSEGRKTGSTVIWQNKVMLSKIKGMLPEGKKENIRILGKEIEEDGKVYIVFDCNDLEEMRRLNRKE